jgi:hypothetical protein
MKRLNVDYSSFVFSLLVVVLFFIFPNITVFASVTPPSITIDSPSDNTILNTTTVVISGTFTDASTPLFTAIENANPISDSTNNATEWKITNNGTSGTWSFTKDLSEGTHTITVQLKDESTNTTNTTPKSITFTIDTKRPYILDTGIVFKGTTPYTVQSGDTLETIALAELGNSSFWTDIAQMNGLTSPYISDKSAKGVVAPGDTISLPVTRMGQDLTSTPPDSLIKISLVDDKPMDQLMSKIKDVNSPYNPIKVMLGTMQIEGTASIIENNSQSGKYVYDVFFKPNTPLQLNTAYIAYLDPSLVDDANGPVFAKFFKFTTKSNMDENPHGHYQLNTNMCAGCHSSHVGANNSLEGGSYEITFNVGLNGNKSESYCMSCHDGTLNAPIIDNMNKQYHHNTSLDSSPNETNSCTSCHNPHQDWSEQNPNLLKDHYVYTHNDGDDVTPKVIDSLDTPCDFCHTDNKIDLQSTSGKYELFSYKKSITVSGVINDYSLCLRCHNTTKKSANSLITDIEQYYNDSASGHYFTPPSDDGGSKLNGAIPCAECHETHGSDNMNMLREKLGNAFTNETFTSNGQTWDAANERQFCLKCHNNKTEIYGKIAVFNNLIIGHETLNTQACSQCHGTGDNEAEKALSTAHAPKKLP